MGQEGDASTVEQRLLRTVTREMQAEIDGLRRENAEMRAEVDRLKNTAELRDIERAEDKREVERLQACLDAACGRSTDDRAERALEWVKEMAQQIWKPGAVEPPSEPMRNYYLGQRDTVEILLREVFGLRVEEVPASVRFVEVGK